MHTRKSQVTQHVVFPCFDGGHLLEEVFASHETHGCQEANHANRYTVIASRRISVVQTDIFLGFRVNAPALRRYAAEHNYRE